MYWACFTYEQFKNKYSKLGIFVTCQKFECIPEIIPAIACVPKSVNPFNQGHDLLFTFSRSVFFHSQIFHIQQVSVIFV